jgi:hypothetical protein
MSVLFAVMGIYVLFFLPPELYIPDKFRIMMGVVLMLYAVHRFVSSRIKQRQVELENDEER